MKTIQLKPYFVGGASVKGMIFNQISVCTVAYLYEVNNNGLIHYEVFKRRKTAVCEDFEKRIYSETIFKERYPKETDFGKWAWTFLSKKSARHKYKSLMCEKEIIKL